MEYLEQLGANAKEASIQMGLLSMEEKKKGLIVVAKALQNNVKELLEENQKDVLQGEKQGVKASLIDRLRLTEERIIAMAEGLKEIADLEDPVGEVTSMKMRPNGLMIGEKRVPIGVIGIIYESRPNVTSDAFGLCFKTGNSVILRGGHDAIYSNMKIVSIIQEVLEKEGLPKYCIQLVEKMDRDTAKELMKLNQYIDVLIPRGGAGLIKTVVQNSTVPVIETGTGNCHIYVDEYADIHMAVSIIVNAKTQRMGVCNACESLVVHEKIAGEALPAICSQLEKNGIEIRGDKKVQEICPNTKIAQEEDWGMEYLDAIISVKVVTSIDEAIAHINKYNTGHSEAIITKNYENAQKFLNEIDAAAVYVNASTRFTDGFEFGFGAEIGISTQKLHARGPMGLKALTTTKYIIYGNGQIRE